MDRAKVLVVDDEPPIVRAVQAYLEKEGFQVYTATDGLGALKAARAFRPDVIVLDIMLPGMDGLEVLTTLRRESDVYIILLTARVDETDRVVGLTLGADDYVTKPFSPRELAARIRAALRRLGKTGENKSSLLFRGLRIDPSARRVWLHDEELHLTPREFELLQALAEHNGMVLSRAQLLERVWGTYYGDDRVVDVHIGNLRRKLGPLGAWIATVRGVGYRFDGEPAL